MRAWIDVETVGGIVGYAAESEVVNFWVRWERGVRKEPGRRMGYCVSICWWILFFQCEGSKWNL